MKTFKHKIFNIDKSILTYLNHKLKCSFLDHIMPLATFLASFEFVTTFCVILFLIPIDKLRFISFKITCSLITTNLFVQLIKTCVARSRPYTVIKNLHLNKIGIDKYSFPSGHTATGFSLFVTLAMFFPAFYPLFIFLAFLIGLSRMYLGVHYPTDVFIGALLGTIFSITTWFLL